MTIYSANWVDRPRRMHADVDAEESSTAFERSGGQSVDLLSKLSF